MKSLVNLRRTGFLAVAFAALFAFTPVAQVGATGSEYIGGTATSSLNFYDTIRVVTDPALPGWEVAFQKDTGPAGLRLGAHDCYPTYNVIGGGTYSQATGEWRAVAVGLAADTPFCIVSRSSSGTGSFNGTLAWD